MKSLAQTFLAGVAGALTVATFMGAAGPLTLRNDGLQFPDGTVQTTAAAADPGREFYLTDTIFQGGGMITDSPLEACAPGFHMASLWEILDVSNLRYATDEQGGFDVFRNDDSGVGPPSDKYGWIRTGYESINAASEGQGNCTIWSSISGSGTAVELEEFWSFSTTTGDPSAVIAPWDSVTISCEGSVGVWCVSD